MEDKSNTWWELFDLITQTREKYQGMMNISGMNCYVNASFLNGNIVGTVSSLYKNKLYSFDFKPLSYLQKSMLLYVELKRLYFTYGKEGIFIDTTNSNL